MGKDSSMPYFPSYKEAILKDKNNHGFPLILNSSGAYDHWEKLFVYEGPGTA